LTAIKFPDAPEKVHKSHLFMSIVIAGGASPRRCIVFNCLEHLHQDCPAQHAFSLPEDKPTTGIGIAGIFLFSADALTHFPLPRTSAVTARIAGFTQPAPQGMSDMGSNQQDPLVICVSPGLNGKWDVSEKGAEQPLISFDEKEDAYAYANELTRSREGATALVEDEEGFYPLPQQNDSTAARRPRDGK
jgi:hypothetical protein